MESKEITKVDTPPTESVKPKQKRSPAQEEVLRLARLKSYEIRKQKAEEKQIEREEKKIDTKLELINHLPLYSKKNKDTQKNSVSIVDIANVQFENAARAQSFLELLRVYWRNNRSCVWGLAWQQRPSPPGERCLFSMPRRSRTC